MYRFWRICWSKFVAGTVVLFWLLSISGCANFIWQHSKNSLLLSQFLHKEVREVAPPDWSYTCNTNLFRKRLRSGPVKLLLLTLRLCATMMKPSVVSQFLLLVLAATFCDAFRFHLPPDSRKCLKEEIHKNVLVTGEYELSEAHNLKTHLTVSYWPTGSYLAG